MRLNISRSRYGRSLWTAFILFCAVIGATLGISSPVQGSVAADQSTATSTITSLEPATGIPLDDALIPDSAISRFAGIPTGIAKVNLATVSVPYLGNPDAPLKIIQVSSYSCSACRTFYENITLNLLPAIRAGQVQFSLIAVTLTGEYDPGAETVAALCALDQGAFWPMTDALFTWRSRYESAAADGRRLELAALKLGLNLDKYNACSFGQAVIQRISSNNQYFNRLKLQYTPSILVNGQWIDPTPSLNQLYRLINQLSAATPISTESPTAAPVVTLAATASAIATGKP